MESKKNWSQNLENYRGLFFMIGIALSLAVTTEIIQWQTEYKTPTLKSEKQEIVESSLRIPITILTKPEPKMPEPVEPEPDPILKDPVIFKIVNNTAPSTSFQSIDLSLLDTVSFEPLKPEVITPIAPFAVENMARPMECEDLRDKDAQLKCFNTWIQSYIAQEVVFPERPRMFGESEKLYVDFVINSFGRVEQVKIIRGENEDFKAEALRVIENLPELVPASQLGQNVPVRVQIPVNFKMQ